MLQDTTEKPVDSERILHELAQRWRSGDTLEYRSRATLNHRNELHLEARIHARFRRPNMARVVFAVSNKEWSRVLVSDGVRVFDRPKGSLLHPPRTWRFALKGRLLQDIPHPLDEVGYFVEQFLSSTPLIPSSGWGTGDGRYTVEAVRFFETVPGQKPKPLYRLTFTSGSARDTILVDAVNYAPIEVVRVGEHVGVVQELLRERFETVTLGVNLLSSVFQWSEADEQGRTLRL